MSSWPHEWIFRPYLRKFLLAFFDDILVYRKSFTSILAISKLSSRLCSNTHCMLSFLKCVFGSIEVAYLGYLILRAGIQADPTKISAMRNWPIPKNPIASRGFLNLTNCYKKFIKGYGSIAAPLTTLLRKKSFCWTEDFTTAAFNKLKKAMASPLDFSKEFVIECDASVKAVGAILM